MPPWKAVAPWPDAKERFTRENSFVLDGVALDNLQESYGKVQPKLGCAIPPYNSHHDAHVRSYFNNRGVKQTLRKTNQLRAGSESIEGVYVDRFHHKGAKHDYLSRRNAHGSGHARELVEGHSLFMKGVKPMNGYNGEFGYRSNVPSLRNHPTTFGVTDRIRPF